MSRAYVKEFDQVLDGDILSPHSFGQEIAALVGEMNGHMGRENVVQNFLTPAKAALDTFNVLEFESASSVQTVIHNDGAQGRNWLLIPDLSVTIEARDGRLQIEAHVTAEIFVQTPPAARVASNASYVLGIRVDGDIVATSGMNREFDEESRMANAAPAVGAGPRLVEAVIRIGQPIYSPTAAAPATNLQADVKGRALVVRYVGS